MKLDPETVLYYIYQPGEAGDGPLFHWYAQLTATGDIHKILGPSVHSISAFMRHFTDPSARLYYLFDDDGWWAVAWSFPMAGGGAWGFWLREDKRAVGSRLALAFIMATLNDALSRFPVLVNVTKQPEVVEKTQRLGYTYVGEIPYLFEGETAYVLQMTREAFEPRFQKWREYNGCRED